MSTDYVPLLAIVVPIACFVFAAWPLLLSRRIRPALLGLGGSGCLGLGAMAVGLLASGIVQLPALTSQALADESAPPASTPAEAALAAEAPPSAKAKPSASDPVIDLSQETIEIPPGRPKWVGEEPKLTGKIHTIPVDSGPYALPNQAVQALDQALVKATSSYIAEQLNSELAPQLLRYDARTIKKRFVKPDNLYHDTARYSIGFMHENFALLEFGPEFRSELDSRWTKVRATSRLAQTGLLAGAGLLLVGSIFGYFRLDNATRGYYTGRLQFMTGAAILAVVGASAVLAQWIHWL